VSFHRIVVSPPIIRLRATAGLPFRICSSTTWWSWPKGAIGIGQLTGSPEELLLDVVDGRRVGIRPIRMAPTQQSGPAVRTVHGLAPATTMIARRPAGNLDAVIN
jgi:hypothetical protein